MDKRAFGVILRLIRQDRLFSQRELARISGVSRTRINRYEAGTATAKPATVRKLARVLKCSPLETALLLGLDREHEELAIVTALLTDTRLPAAQKTLIRGILMRLIAHVQQESTGVTSERT